jgi:uncharacterized protein (TIGR02996 family)
VEEDRFIQAILADPDDTTIRLVYADWLEERGDPRGELLRLEAALMGLPGEAERWEGMAARIRELRATIDRDWLTALGRSPVELCGQRFGFQCPKQWDRLRLTSNIAVRFCDCCQRDVYYCHTIEEARHLAELRHCIAVDPGVPRTWGDLLPRMNALCGVPFLPERPPVPRGSLLRVPDLPEDDDDRPRGQTEGRRVRGVADHTEDENYHPRRRKGRRRRWRRERR